MRYGVALLFPIVAGGVVAACHLVSGVGDLSFVEPTPTTGGATPTTSTTTGQGGSGATTSSTPTGGTGGSGGGGGSAGSGGQGGAGGAALCLLDLEDTFDAPPVDLTRWDESPTSATAGIVGGLYEIEPLPSTAGAWASLTSFSSYNLTECSVFVQLIEALNNEGSNRTTFYISLTGDYADSVGFLVSEGNLVARVVDGGAEAVLTTQLYSSSAHRWLRLRESGGTLYLEASASTDTWEILAETTAPSYVDAVYVRIAAGNWAGDSASPGRARFDDVNVWP